MYGHELFKKKQIYVFSETARRKEVKNMIYQAE